MEYVYVYEIIYAVIGFIVSIIYWNKKYEKPYRLAKKLGHTEDGAACLYLLCLLIFWPILVVYVVYKLIKKKWLQLQ